MQIDKKAEQATALFIKASLRHPAHGEKQAEYIARTCDRRGLNSTELGEALMEHPGMIGAIVRVANYFHRLKGVGEVHALSVRSVVRRTFGC